MVLKEQLSLVDIARAEVKRYDGPCGNCRSMFIADETQHIYAVVTIPDDANLRPAWIVVMARVVGNYVVIEEDSTLDKPLVDALMTNASVPRQQIILAYAGERLPE